MPLAIFRADASAAIGTGHVRRCLTLADVLASQGWGCGFAVALGTLEAAPWLDKSAHEHHVLDDACDDIESLTRRWSGGCDFLVVDQYEIGADFESKARPWARNLMTIDDIPGRKHDCDILLDQNLGRRADDFTGHVPKNCQLLLGPVHALLRPEFTRGRSITREIPAIAERVLVTLGGSDPQNFTARVISTICELGPETPRTLIVVGSANPHAKELEAMVSEVDHMDVVYDIDDMASAMERADLAISGSGSTCWELAAMGLPAIVIDESAGGVASALEAAGTAVRVGPDETGSISTLTGVLKALVADPVSRRVMAEAGPRLVDGAGAGRVVACMTRTIENAAGDPRSGNSATAGA